MELLGDVGPIESRFGPFEDGVSVEVRLRHGLRQINRSLIDHFGRTRCTPR
jgi:hypothetical protein